MVAPVYGTGTDARTRLYFGSVVVPPMDARAGQRRMGFAFHSLLWRSIERDPQRSGLQSHRARARESSMVTVRDKSVRTFGVWSAVFCTIFSLAYVLAQIGEWLGLLGSAGGPHSRSTPVGLVTLLTPSLLLGISFVVLTVSIHYYAEARARIWSHVAVAFASMYATLISIVYYVQLAFVIPRLARGDTSGIELLVFEPFDSFLYAIDVFGYSLMSLSTLFAAAVFSNQGFERWIRWALIANGCLVPFLALQMYYPPLIWGGSLWGITFPTATWLLAIHFKRLRSR
jgi:hypothetical protein